jgi:hypothetical protein
MARCTAQAKRSGQRCRLHARRNYQVCRVHGAGKKAKPGGRPPTHGRYSRFLNPEEVEDFEAFKASFDLTEDLAFAATKVYHAAGKVKPEHLGSLLEVPSRIAERRKRVLEGIVLKVDVDVEFLQTFIAKVLEYVTNPRDQDDLLAFAESYLGESAGD